MFIKKENSPRMRVLDFLIENSRTHWNLNELKQAGVGYSTLKLLMPRLERLGMVVVNHKYGKMKFYGINKVNPITKDIIDLWIKINVCLADEHIRTSNKEGIK